jgi:hypothetical protein
VGAASLGRLGWAAGFVFVAARMRSRASARHQREGRRQAVRRHAEAAAAAVPAATVFCITG